MKNLILIILLILIPTHIFAANSQSSGNYYEFATVDTNPGAAGYGTNEINPRTLRKKSKLNELYFTIGGTGTTVVTLQFKRNAISESTWQDYETYIGIENKILEAGAAGEVWRAIVKQDEYTSGSKTFGFSW